MTKSPSEKPDKDSNAEGVAIRISRCASKAGNAVLDMADSSRREILAATFAVFVLDVFLYGRDYVEQGDNSQVGWLLKNLKSGFSTATSQQIQQPKQPEGRETPTELTPFEQVLAKSEPIFLPNTRTYRDNILSPHAVSRYLLNDAFRYTGREDVEYMGHRERANRFSQIGNKSGYLKMNEQGSGEWKNTTLAKAINTILSAESLSDKEIADWVAFEYDRAFQVKFDPNLIKITRDKSNAVASVNYDAPNGMNPDVAVQIAEVVNEASSMQPGGRISARRETQKLLGANNRILLPSGLSPQFDIVVPTKLMKRDVSFDLKIIAGGIEWRGLKASDLADRMERLEQRVAKNGNRGRDATVYNYKFSYGLIAPLVEKGDAKIKQLAEFLVKDISANDNLARIGKLVDFVQTLPYRTEYDSDMSREGMLTLFNGGGDCNNVCVLFSELMAALGYDSALLHVCSKNNADILHVIGGIPAAYAQNPQQTWWLNDKKDEKWAPIELTSKGRAIGEKLVDSTVFEIEVVRAKQ